MSFLTKFFIVLHVVLTMLFVAATVVFVNRVEDFRTAQTQLRNELQIAQQRAQNNENLAQTALADAAAVREQAAAEVARIRQQLNTAQSEIRQRDTQLATAQQNLASADARLQAATAALQTAQKTNALLQDQINQTRQVADKIQQQNTDLLTANSDLNQRLQVASRQLRNSNEEIEDLRNQIATGGEGPAGATQAGAGGGTPTPTRTDVAISGVINDRRTINGVPYATINVGSNDNVSRGMVFNIIDREAGDFLGYLTVDRVEEREASGRLEGPRLGDIRVGNEARTQL